MKKKIAAGLISAAAIVTALPAAVPAIAAPASHGPAVQASQAAQTDQSKESEVSPDWQSPKPWVRAENMEHAGKLAGFTMGTPKIKGYRSSGIYVADNAIEQEYESGSRWLLLKKGSGSGDISGDHDAYKSVRHVKAGDLKITASGSKGKYFKAIWKYRGYSYSIISDTGLKLSQIKAIAAEMK